ncbi:AHH domain-containing protein [Novosphingobium piscinae]|uniref:AHH domain-containing protein n=1 Tax=Novosphingobium piscinae TaxID=1507448 RepID=UPI001FE791FD|nr:AHH domain-containing protein [Novosphingobium piscinae]
MPRGRLPFRAVNRVGAPDYHPGLQRHHLLPRAVLAAPSFAALFAALGPGCVGFDDFRRNGLLLPGTCEAAQRLGLPLHRGPHPHYTAVVMDRLGAIERDWAGQHRRCARAARRDALFRLGLLQRGLRQSLLRERPRRRPLSRRDPRLRDDLFADLDAMAEAIWGACAPWS